MTTFEPIAYKIDDGSHDACPTCGARLRTTTPADSTAKLRHSCSRSCGWSTDFESAPQPTDDARLVTDGGTTTRAQSDTAHDRLGRLTSAAAQRVRETIDAENDARPNASDLRAVLEQSNGRIAYLVQHGCGVEYIFLEGDEIRARTRHGENKLWPETTLETDSALARRTRKRFDIVARENVPAWARGVDQ